jgi:hypothetical protein
LATEKCLMGNYSEMHLERLRSRFPALAATPEWQSVEVLCRGIDDDYDDTGEAITALHNTCVRLSQLQGLPFGPRVCGECGQPLDGDFGGDRLSCLDCIAAHERRLEERAEAEVREKERRVRLTPEERAEEDRKIRFCMRGLIARPVQ